MLPIKLIHCSSAGQSGVSAVDYWPILDPLLTSPAPHLLTLSRSEATHVAWKCGHLSDPAILRVVSRRQQAVRLLALLIFGQSSHALYLQIESKPTMEGHVLMCLRCRGRGHMAKDCILREFDSERDWMYSENRQKMDFGSAWTTSEQTLCWRCDELGILDIRDASPPWNSQAELESAVSQRDEAIRCLGKVADVQFWADCHLCHCFFALAPNASSLEQDVLLVPDWTLCRVAGEFGVVFDTVEKRQYATCLVIALHPSPISTSFAINAHRSDAICLLNTDLSVGRTLGGKKLDRDNTNMEMIHECIQRCTKLHGADCGPVLTGDLRQTRLFDIEQRKIVQFPDDIKHEYVAVSYVWGGTPAQSFKLGDKVGALPATLEDAASFTRALGHKHLWTDYLCIDQLDEHDKDDQIGRMWSIYRGAYLTIFAMSGASADAGLSGYSRSTSFSQLTCCVNGRRLVGTMPTFSLQSWTAPWSQRAWTLQEAYLSPRCLFFTDHQIYFDCSAMLCSESLDHTNSWAHNLSPASNPTDRGFFSWITDQIGAGGYRMPLRDPGRRLETWGIKLNMYSFRHMTKDEDALRAFDGIAQHLQSVYPHGFYYGLPVEDFDWGLLWWSQEPLSRRKGFPSWTWAGWKGPLWFGGPSDVTKTLEFSVHLDISGFRSGGVAKIFERKSCAPRHPATKHLLEADPLHKVAQSPEGHVYLGSVLPSCHEGILVIDAVCLRFKPDFSNPRPRPRLRGSFGIYDTVIEDAQCVIIIISLDQLLSDPVKKDETFVVVARGSRWGMISHHLLMLRYENDQQAGQATRVTTMELLVDPDRLDVLRALKPCMRRVVLA